MFSKLTQKKIDTALESIRDPQSDAPLLSLMRPQGLVIKGGHIILTLEIDPAKAKDLEPLRQHAEKILAGLRGAKKATLVLTAEAPAQKPKPIAPPKPSTQEKRLPSGVKAIIAVASGKGGVGKSTVACNLAIALQKSGLSVGLMDADVYGPSQPKLLGCDHEKPESIDKKIIPVTAHRLKVMSMGFMVDADSPIIWRGAMIQSAMRQMLYDVDWSDNGKKPLDVLIIDMPPGTGDAPLSLTQLTPLHGAIIVCTPQDLALLDAKKGIEMFRKTNVPLLGLIENMSMFHCPNCDHETPIFGHGGAKEEAGKLNIPFLGALPLNIDIRLASDSGTPKSEPFVKLANKIKEALSQ